MATALRRQSPPAAPESQVCREAPPSSHESYPHQLELACVKQLSQTRGQIGKAFLASEHGQALDRLQRRL
jgi:hypothetical protein